MFAMFSSSGSLLAYFGLGAGAELIPYFFALVTFAGAAFLAVVQWPIQALYRRFGRAKGGDGDDRSQESVAASEIEAPREDGRAE
jgi:hypothetical protein